MNYTYECRNVMTKGIPPEKRWGATLTAVGDKVILFGGSMGKSGFYDEICYINPSEMEWTRLKFQSIERSNHVALPVSVFDKTGTKISRILMINGGSKNKEFYNNTYWFDTFTYTFLNIMEYKPENMPEPRRYHACSYIHDCSRIIFFGGETKQGVDNRVYILDISQFYTNIVTWEKSILHKDSVIVPPLKFATLTYHPLTGVAILFGGTSQEYQNNNMIYIYYRITNLICNGTWVLPQLTGYDFHNIKGRWGHSADMINNKLFIYSGMINYNDNVEEAKDCNTLLCIELIDYPGRIPTSTSFVLQISIPFDIGFVPLPPPTRKHCTALVGNSIYVFGGYDGKYFYNSFKLINLGIEDEKQNELKQYCNRYGISESTYITLRQNRVSLASLPYLLDRDYINMNINVDEINKLRLNSKVLMCYESNPLLLPNYNIILEHIIDNLNFTDSSVDFDKPINIAKKIVTSDKILSIDTYEKGMKDKTKDPNETSVLEEKMKLVDIKNNELENKINKLKEEVDNVIDNNLCNMCKKQHKNVLFMPCKCFLYCKECSEKIMSQKVCPNCNKRIKNHHIVYTE